MPGNCYIGSVKEMACAFENYKDYISGEVPEIFYIPEKLDKEPVTEIKEKAFYGCRGLTRVVVPKTVERIGSYAFAECRELKHFACPKAAVSIGDYAFYNCMGLKEISIGQELKNIGYGAFKNCLELSKITMDIGPDKPNALNSILQDEFQEVDVTIHYLDSEGSCASEARLVFTDYQYEYVPEIEARQFNWETYGSGDSYRISIRDKDIDYGKYDSVFPVAMVEDNEETLFKIAAGRLCWPYRLSDESRERYESYIKAHMPKILERIIGAADKDERAGRLFPYLLEHSLLTDKDLDLALDLAQRCQKSGLTALLMDSLGKRKPSGRQALHSRFSL